jgi:hypothetical protein
MTEQMPTVRRSPPPTRRIWAAPRPTSHNSTSPTTKVDTDTASHQATLPAQPNPSQSMAQDDSPYAHRPSPSTVNQQPRAFHEVEGSTLITTLPIFCPVSTYR